MSRFVKAVGPKVLIKCYRENNWYARSGYNSCVFEGTQ